MGGEGATGCGGGTSATAGAGAATGGGVSAGRREPGASAFAWLVSGNCRVVFSGTLVSGVFENTGRSLVARRFSDGGAARVMARLADCAASEGGRTGCTY